MKQTTIKEIAALAGTSRGTVDRVINKRGRVSPKVKARVLQVIDETNYRPNTAARSLYMSHRGLKIGAVIGGLKNSFFDLVIAGIKDEVEHYRSSGISLILKNVSLFDKEANLKAIAELKEEGVDAVLIAAIGDEDIQAALNSLHVPLVAVNLNLEAKNKLCFVGTNYLNSGRLAGNFASLIVNEPTGCGIVVGSLTHPGQSLRCRGFEEAIEPKINLTEIIENQDENECSYNLVKTMLQNPSIGLICFLGAGEEGGLKAIAESGKHPKVITVDQSEGVLEGLQNGLVAGTINQHPYTQGVRSVDLIFDSLVCRNKVPKEIIMDNVLILKESILTHKLAK
ncbi:MAG: LacI family transcriptional regulator [Bacilli bacterium]|jgi:LacI family transcriptional regulator|nr:LacI family transcriptional regulator [Bacilli bacterium]